MRLKLFLFLHLILFHASATFAVDPVPPGCFRAADGRIVCPNSPQVNIPGLGRFLGGGAFFGGQNSTVQGLDRAFDNSVPRAVAPSAAAPAPTAVPQATESVVDAAPQPEPDVATAAASESRAESAEVFVEDGEATRLFAGPTQFPPQNFAAYAILAFKSGADASDVARYVTLCQAFFHAIPESDDSSPASKQLVTIWPVSSNGIAEKLRGMKDADPACNLAARNYGHVAGLRAIRDARKVSLDMHEAIKNNRGPFLFAWNPATKKGQKDALILRMDLSNVDSAYHAKRRFEFWVQEIERRPDLWLDGWQQVSIKDRVAQNLDKYGEVILAFLGAE